MKQDESKKKQEFITAKQKFQREHRAKGLCLDCHNVPDEGRTRCPSCMENRRLNERKRRQAAIKKGFCAHCCKRPHLEKHRFCEQCFFMNLSVGHFKTAKCWPELKAKWEGQNGKCALSGFPLTLGVDAELDHIIPKAKKGCKEISNVQWVLHVVNRMKRDMYEADFLEIVSAIYTHSVNKESDV